MKTTSKTNTAASSNNKEAKQLKTTTAKSPVVKSSKTSTPMTKLKSRVKMSLTKMFWMNPVTKRAVGYQRARILNLINKTGVRFGFINPATGNIVRPERAMHLGLV